MAEQSHTARGGTAEGGVHRAVVLHDNKVIVDLIELTLNHGLFVVESAGTGDDVEAILRERRPHLALVDLEHSSSCRWRPISSSWCARRVAPHALTCRRRHRILRWPFDDPTALPADQPADTLRAMIASLESLCTELIAQT